MNLKSLSIVSIAILAAVLAGCSSVDSTVAPSFQERAVKKVAVVHVVGMIKGEAARGQISDFFAMEMMKKGYDVVERQQAMAVLTEQEGKLPGNLDEQAIFVGKLLNVDGVIVINIPEYGSSMNLTAKMLAVKDGTTLWIASGSGSTGKTAYTVLGAVAGAAAGAAVAGSERAIGGAVGGVVGGVAGYALSPQEAEKLKSVVTKMCKGLPARQ